MAEAKGNQTPNTPNTPQIRESDLAQLKVEQLRSELKSHGVSGTSAMRKDDLVKLLLKTLRSERRKTAPSTRSSSTQSAGGKKSTGSTLRRGAGTSKSLKYAQEVQSREDKPERAGLSLATTDQEVIRQWAQERGGVPSTVSSGARGRPRVLRLDFPRGGRSEKLREITWEEWFKVFEERRLNFIYQDKRSDGRQSNFFRLERPEREDG